jgi:hypothetical protein
MRTLPARQPIAPQFDDDQVVPEELVGRLYRAQGAALVELLDGLSAVSRANLAMFCYRKAHLRRTGLAIAATCDWPTLTQTCGPSLGEAMFAQAREGEIETVVDRRPKITLPRVGSTRARSKAIAAAAADDEDEAEDCEATPREPAPEATPPEPARSEAAPPEASSSEPVLSEPALPESALPEPALPEPVPPAPVLSEAAQPEPAPNRARISWRSIFRFRRTDTIEH